MNNKTTTYNLVLTALMMSLVMVMTYIIRIPVPATQGYIHLGDCMIFFSVLLLGWKWGAVAAGVGSAMADLIAGYAHYVPITFVVKGLMAIAMGICIDKAVKSGFTGGKLRAMETLGMAIAGIVMCAGYYTAESLMYGSWITPLGSIPMNMIQFGVGIVLATALATALYKTPAKSKFAYRLNESR
ncbi:MAG: ECF transporter S component [Anaerovoracaceae bacterium]